SFRTVNSTALLLDEVVDGTTLIVLMDHKEYYITTKGKAMKTPRFLMSMLVTAGLSVLILSCNKTEADEALNVNQALGNPQNSLASNDSWKTINTQIF